MVRLFRPLLLPQSNCSHLSPRLLLLWAESLAGSSDEHLPGVRISLALAAALRSWLLLHVFWCLCLARCFVPRADPLFFYFVAFLLYHFPFSREWCLLVF